MTEELLTYRMLTSELELLPDVIRYDDKTYSYSSVIHLGRYARRTSLNYIPIGDFLRITIYIENRKNPITIQNSIGLIFTTGKLKKIYERLVEKTFRLRVNNYLRQTKNQGFFEYNGAKIFSNGEVLIGDRKVNLYIAKMWLEPFKLVLKQPTGFFAAKQKISTKIDQDVFFALLKELYGIEFNH